MLSLTFVYFVIWATVVYCLVLKIYLELTRGQFGNDEKLNKKVALVTGATQGIGVEVVRDLISRGCRVWLACRDVSKGTEIAKELGSNCVVVKMDLCSFNSVRKAVDEFCQKESKLDLLINNAAVIPECMNTFTEDGFEVTYQTNYLSPVYLTLLLIDRLRNGDDTRVVNVSSNLHHVGLLNSIKTDAVRESSWWESPLQNYANSKLALNMASRELARILFDDGISVNAVHPGATRTKITFHGSTSMAVFFRFVYQLFGKTPAEAAQAISYVAASQQIKGITGRYFVDCGPGWNNWRVFDQQRRKRLLEETCQLLELPSPYKQ